MDARAELQRRDADLVALQAADEWGDLTWDESQREIEGLAVSDEAMRIVAEKYGLDNAA